MMTRLLLFCCVAYVTTQWVKEMENDGLYEGDMILTPSQLNDAKNGKLGYATTKYNHWPTTIYYDWDASLAGNSGIRAAIADYHRYTCLRFYKRTNQKDYMYFSPGNGGCSSGVGYFRNSGKHQISLGSGCTQKGTVLHEMAHRLGIYHEQSRPDRDDYVTIVTENIRPSMVYNFNKQRESNIDSLQTTYDYYSIMHYADWSFSTNRKPTIITKDPKMQKIIGNRSGLSDIDKTQINRMYKCETVPTKAPTQPPPSNGAVLKHSGGLCLEVDARNQLVLRSSCKTKFSFDNGKLTLSGSSKCAYATGTYSNALINVKEGCTHTFSKSDQEGSYFALKHGGTRKCIHPLKGASRPSENTRLVIYSGCNEMRLKFKLI